MTTNADRCKKQRDKYTKKGYKLYRFYLKPLWAEYIEKTIIYLKKLDERNQNK